MSKTIDKSTLGYLGVDFQYRLVKCFFEDKKFFMKIQHIVDQNMFTDETLRRIVGFVKDRFTETEDVPSYREISIKCRSVINDSIGLETALETITRISKMDSVGMDIVESESEKFFKQQNLTKAINKAQEIIKKGEFDSYYKIEELIQKALETNTKEQFGWRLFENIETDLSDDYRITIPTGAHELDQSLYGGLGKGELGIIIAPLGVGKAQPLYSKVLTPQGWTTMGKITTDDKVIGRDGKPHRVLGIYPQGIRSVYTITLSNGDICQCDIDHLWDVSIDGGRTYRTWSLREIISNGYKVEVDGNKVNKFMLPKNEIIDFDERELTVNPYSLGCFLACEEKEGVIVDEKTADDIDGIIKTHGRNIPDDYIYNTISNRVDFIQGFIDTCAELDGEVFKFKVNGKEILYGLKQIFKSLGGFFRYENVHDDVYFVEATLEMTFEEELYIDRIDYLGEDYTQCIMVDSDEHLYITDNFIVTHNTSCTTGFAANAATTKTETNNYKGYKVLHFYFEDTDVNIRRKYYGYVTDIDACDLSLPDTKPLTKKLLAEDTELKRMLHDNLIGERLTSGDVSASELKRKIQSYIARGFKPDLVIVDYFECLKPEKSMDMMDNEWSREGVTMRKLEAMAHEFDIALWVPVQGTKDSIGAEIVGVSQAGGSVKKTQIGHIIITLAQTPEQKSRGRLNLHIGKARVARIGKNYFSNVKFNNGTCKFDFTEDNDMDMGNFQYGSMNNANSTKVAREVMNRQRNNNNKY